MTLSEALNHTIRRGLARIGVRRPRRYRLASRGLRLRPGVDLEHALSLADELDDVERARQLDGK
jgi:hypothetical protein